MPPLDSRIGGDTIACEPSFVFGPPQTLSAYSHYSASSCIPAFRIPPVGRAGDTGSLGSTESKRTAASPAGFGGNSGGDETAKTNSLASGTSDGSLHLTLLDDDDMESVFRMDSSASFEQVALVYADLVGTQPHRVQLWYSGARIRHSQTPAEV